MVYKPSNLLVWINTHYAIFWLNGLLTLRNECPMVSANKRGKVWEAQVSYKNPITGEYDKIRKSGFKTKTEALNYAREEERILQGGYNLDKSITLKNYFQEWMETYKKPKVRQETYTKYQTTHDSISEYFKDSKLAEITKRLYQQVLNKYAETHARPTVSKFNNHVRQSVKKAIEEKLILEDFTENVILGGTDNMKLPSEKYINYSDVQKLINYLTPKVTVRTPAYYMIILAFSTGLRYAELWGLTWNDIDFENNLIDVNKTFDYKYQTGFKPTKNSSSIRKIPIDEKTMELFKNYQEEQKLFFQEMGIDNEYGLIFYHYIEGIYSNNTVNKSLRRALQTLKIKPLISMHGARHTYGSVLLYKGVDISVVAQLMGHRDSTTTQKVYLHVIKEMQEKNFKEIKNIMKELYD